MLKRAKTWAFAVCLKAYPTLREGCIITIFQGGNFSGAEDMNRFAAEEREHVSMNCQGSGGQVNALAKKAESVKSPFD
jgi:hypothetical protein